MQLSDPENEPKPFEFIKICQIYLQSKALRKYNKNDCRVLNGCFSAKTIISKPLPRKFDKNRQVI